LASLEERLGRSQKNSADMDKMRGDLMGEVRQMSIQVERSREKLSRCRTEREANAAQREIEELRKLYRDREIEVEKLDGFLEQARTDMAQIVVERDAIVLDLSAGRKRHRGSARTGRGRRGREGSDSQRLGRQRAAGLVPTL